MKNFIAVGVIFLLVILVSNSLFVVKETERAVMLQFGELVQDSIDPGLHVKIPWVNNVRKFDARILTEDAPRRRYLTLEQKALEVDSYAKWRIVDVGQFYISTRGNTSNILRHLPGLMKGIIPSITSIRQNATASSCHIVSPLLVSH